MLFVQEWACNYIDFATYVGKCEAITVSGGGSSAGASAVCAGEVDIGSMSRQFKDSEATAENDGFTFSCVEEPYTRVTQLQVGVDGIAVFVQRGSELESCLEDGLTYAQLRWIFSSLSMAELEAEGHDLSGIENDDGDAVKEWSDIYAACPEEAIFIYAPDSDSGTQVNAKFFIFCFYFPFVGISFFILNCAQAVFAEEVFDEDLYEAGEEYFAESGLLSATDDVITDGVSNDDAGIGFVGYAHYLFHDLTIFAIPICKSSCSASSQFVMPTEANIEDGSYALSRQLYMNIKQESWGKVLSYLQYGFDAIGQYIISGEIGYVALSESFLNSMQNRFNGSTEYSDYGTAPEANAGSSSNKQTGLIIGIIIATLAIMGLIGILMWYGRKYKEGRFNEAHSAENNLQQQQQQTSRSQRTAAPRSSAQDDVKNDDEAAPQTAEMVAVQSNE